jgi:8-oxo-dGTP pyrophosphatase MutT (NUDIX family)
LKLIELFLKTVDRKEMIDKIRYRFEEIVQNDTIKNVIPQFKQGGEAPEIDPGTGRVVSKAEREEAEAQRRSQAVDELSTMFESKKKIKVLIKESVPFGGYSPGMAGTGVVNRGQAVHPYKSQDPGGLGADLKKVAKAVLIRNSRVLLLKNEKGWDLPGGHIKQGENILDGLKREVFEETGLTIGNFQSLGHSHRHKHFFCASFPRDDIRLSHEHSEFVFAPIEKIKGLPNLKSYYKEAIFKCLDLNEGMIGTIKIVIG